MDLPVASVLDELDQALAQHLLRGAAAPPGAADPRWCHLALLNKPLA